MANYTENFNLIKPEDDEYYDVADFNENMDVIDAALTESMGINSVISADGQGVRIIKSIQTVECSSSWGGIIDSNNYITISRPIQTINPARSIVLVHRVQDPGSLVYLHFTLTENTLQLKFLKASNTPTIGLFQIIEFY